MRSHDYQLNGRKFLMLVAPTLTAFALIIVTFRAIAHRLPEPPAAFVDDIIIEEKRRAAKTTIRR